MKKFFVTLTAIALCTAAFGATAKEKAQMKKTAMEEKKAEKAAMEAEKKADREAREEERKVAKEAKAAEKEKKATMSNGKRVMHEKRDILYDSLEERVDRAPAKGAVHDAAVADAFVAGKERLQFLLAEEEDITKIEAELGLEPQEHDFENVKFDKTVEDYKNAKTESERLDIEHKKLSEYLARLQNLKKAAGIK